MPCAPWQGGRHITFVRVTAPSPLNSLDFVTEFIFLEVHTGKNPSHTPNATDFRAPNAPPNHTYRREHQMNKVTKAVALVSFLGAATLANATNLGPTNFNVTVNLTS